jgi:hypothetical protein
MLGLIIAWSWFACSAPPATPEPAPRPAVEKAPVRAKAKTGNMVEGKAKTAPPRGKSAKVGKGRPAQGVPMPAPVGAAGPVAGVLTLTTEQVPVTPPAPAPTPAPPPADGAAPPAEGAPPAPAPAPVEGAPMKTVTNASMALTWGEAGKADVKLGQVDGTCAVVPSVPVGPVGRQHTPLWTVSCDDGTAKSELYILQVNNLLAVVRGAEGAAPGAFKPVRRVPLVAGAMVERR